MQSYIDIRLVLLEIWNMKGGGGSIWPPHPDTHTHTHIHTPEKTTLTKSSLIRVKNLLASCYLINLNFLVSHTAHFDKTITSPLFAFGTLGLLLSVYSLHFKQYDNIALQINKNLWWTVDVFRFLVSSFTILFSFNTLFTKANSSWLTDELIKNLEIKTSMLFNLFFANNTIFLCFFSFS